MNPKPGLNVSETRLFRIKFHVMDSEPIKLHPYTSTMIEIDTVKIEYSDAPIYNLSVDVSGLRVLNNGGRGASHERHYYSYEKIPEWLTAEIHDRAPEWWPGLG